MGVAVLWKLSHGVWDAWAVGAWAKKSPSQPFQGRLEPSRSTRIKSRGLAVGVHGEVLGVAQNGALVCLLVSA